MKKAREQLYEGMYILNAALSEDARKKAIEKLEGEITDKGGEIQKVIDWGRKRLAYEVNGKREGHYFLLYFTAPTSSIKELWEGYHLNEDLMRFMTVQAEVVPESLTFKSLAREGGGA